MKQKYTKEQEKVTFLRMIRAELSVQAEKAANPDLRREILSLAEIVGYSDPMSSDELRELEESVKNNILFLGEELSEGREAEAENRIRKLYSLWTERSKKCAVLKRRR